MTAIQKMRRNFTVLLYGMGALSLVCLVYLVWPNHSTAATRQAEEKALRQELAAKKLQAGPLQDVQEKLARSQQDVKKLTQERVPSRFSDITDTLHKVAQAHGVSAQRIQYDTDKSALAGVSIIKITTAVSGDYTRLAQFINALEREKILFVIKQISLTQQQQAGSVELQIRFETYLKDKS